MHARLEPLLRGLDQAFDQRAWHGPNLTGAIRGLTEQTASWRPAPDRHNAWELIVHAAYWKYRLLRYLATTPPAAFDEPGSNFFERPADDLTLHTDRKRLADWHAQLREAVAAFPAERLTETAYDRYTFEDLVLGAAAHDVYHAGQIRLLRRLQGNI